MMERMLIIELVLLCSLIGEEVMNAKDFDRELEKLGRTIRVFDIDFVLYARDVRLLDSDGGVSRNDNGVNIISCVDGVHVISSPFKVDKNEEMAFLKNMTLDMKDQIRSDIRSMIRKKFGNRDGVVPGMRLKGRILKAWGMKEEK